MAIEGADTMDKDTMSDHEKHHLRLKGMVLCLSLNFERLGQWMEQVLP
jgi:hypothetical protein